MVAYVLGVEMFLVTEEKKRWWRAKYNCHGKMLYIYKIESEIEKKLFKSGQYFETAEEALNFLEKEWEK